MTEPESGLSPMQAAAVDAADRVGELAVAAARRGRAAEAYELVKDPGHFPADVWYPTVAVSLAGRIAVGARLPADVAPVEALAYLHAPRDASHARTILAERGGVELSSDEADAVGLPLAATRAAAAVLIASTMATDDQDAEIIVPVIERIAADPVHAMAVIAILVGTAAAIASDA